MRKDNPYQVNFKKILGLWDSVAIIIAIVIGVGIFRVPSEVGRYLSSPNLILLAWLVGGIISMLGCLCYAELSASFPKTGGNYVYLKESCGPWAGFLFGWTELFAVRTGSIAAIAFIFAEYSASFLSLDKYWVKPIAISSIIVLSIVNTLGLRYGKRAQNIFVIPKILAISGIIIFGLFSGKGSIPYLCYPAIGYNKNIFLAFGLALIPILWTYGGWHENTFMAEETRNARVTLPTALIIGISSVTAVYLLINFTYLYLIPAGKISDASLIAADVFQILCGRNGKKILEALIMISSLGCINAMIMTGSRVVYAMARDNIIFRYMGEISVEYGIPYRAIIINAILSIVLVIFGTFTRLLFFTGFFVWLFFALAVGGIFILRRRLPDIERPYKVWGYPLVPTIFIFTCMVLFINTIVSYPFQSFAGLCILLCGIPAYMISQMISKNLR